MTDSRLFKLLYLLLEHQHMTAGELAGRLEVSTRTIYRDVDALSQAGVPIYAAQGKGGGVALMEHYTLDRAMLTGEEQAHLLTALRSLPDSLGGEEVVTKLSALFRPSQPDWLKVELTPWQSQGEERNFSFYKNAILDGHVLEFTYLSAYSTECRCKVLPACLVFKGRAWYLQGWRLDKEAYRTYRLSRILDVRDTGESMALPESPPDIEAGFSGGNAAPIDLRFSPAMAYRVYDEFEEGEVSLLPNGSLEVSVSFPEDGWVYGYLLSFGPQVAILSPERIRRRVGEMAGEIFKKCENPDMGCQGFGATMETSQTKEDATMKEQTFCQSCAMPLSTDLRGTEADGSPSPHYCKYCYEKGKFIGDMTMEEMIAFCAGPMAQANPGMTQEQAKAQMEKFFPQLLRWKKEGS